MTRASLVLLFLMGLLLPFHSSVLAADRPGPSDNGGSSKIPAIESIAVDPPSLKLVGSDSSIQVAVNGLSASGRHFDLGAETTFSIQGELNSPVAQVNSKGRVTPLQNGKAPLQIVFRGKTMQVPVEVSGFAENQPIHFTNDIVPVLTKFGCNAGGCHGKLSGQNGFRLSLLGFDPELDYMTLVQEGRGRRISPSAPERSPLLLKATGAVGHGGGRKIDPDSDEFKLLCRWIAMGSPWGAATDPTLSSIQVAPNDRILNRFARQQLRVVATYSDGAQKDITRRVQFESNQAEIASVDNDGLVRTHAQTGEAAIMARYQGQVVVFRASVPMEKAPDSYAFQPKTLVDEPILKQWRRMNLAPSPRASDEEWLRRVYLDLTGTLPSPADIASFKANASPGKDADLVDKLLDSEEYAALFAQKWADILRVKRGNQPERARGTFLFYDWIRTAMREDKPYDQFVREIVTALGTEENCPPVVWYKDLQTADQFVDNVSQVFLGSRLQCAQCHHHPYEKWSQDDYWGVAAFFGRVARKPSPVPGILVQNNNNQRQIVYLRSTGNVINKRTNKPARPRPLDSEVLEVDPERDTRHQLVDWMTKPANPFLAPSVANRYWSFFFTKGLVDPVDDFRVSNPPSNPELLNALANDLVRYGWSLKRLCRVLTTSEAYRLSSDPIPANQEDRQSFARHYPKRMPAEVFLDAVCQVTGSPANFNGLPTDTHAPRRAIMLPDESFSSYFLDVFGRPQRQSACECERVGEANLAQILHMLNSDEVQTRISGMTARADKLARDPRPHEVKVRELFQLALGHDPDPNKLKLALEHITQAGKNTKSAYENIVWALINTKEFAFVR